MTPPRKSSRFVLAAGALALVVLAGCSEAVDNRQNPLEAHGEDAELVLDLFTPVAFIAILVGIFITAATIYVAIRFRDRPGKNENPKQTHGNSRLEIGWTIIPALLLAVIAVPTVATVGTAMIASSSAGRIVQPISRRVLPWICFGFSFLPGR